MSGEMAIQDLRMARSLRPIFCTRKSLNILTARIANRDGGHANNF